MAAWGRNPSKNNELAADSLRSSAPKQVSLHVGKSELLKKGRLARENPDSLKSSALKQVRWFLDSGPQHLKRITVAVAVLDHGYDFTTKRWNPGCRTKPRLAGTSLNGHPT